jgi:hypothetical protein
MSCAGFYDAHVSLACDITGPTRQGQRNLLRALLLCNATFEQIAQHCGLNVDVAVLFEALFWNCRDRLNERIYLARICQQGVFAEAPDGSDHAEFTADPVRVAYGSGRVEDVLAEIEAHANTATPAEGYKFVGHQLLARAAMGLKLDRVSASENPPLIPALRLLSQMKRAVRTLEKGPISGPDSAGAIAMSSHGITEQEEQYQMAVHYQDRPWHQHWRSETGTTNHPGFWDCRPCSWLVSHLQLRFFIALVRIWRKATWNDTAFGGVWRWMG